MLYVKYLYNIYKNNTIYHKIIADTDGHSSFVPAPSIKIEVISDGNKVSAPEIFKDLSEV